jgi:hypothetical protein
LLAEAVRSAMREPAQAFPEPRIVPDSTSRYAGDAAHVSIHSYQRDLSVKVHLHEHTSYLPKHQDNP